MSIKHNISQTLYVSPQTSIKHSLQNSIVWNHLERIHVVIEVKLISARRDSSSRSPPGPKIQTKTLIQKIMNIDCVAIICDHQSKNELRIMNHLWLVRAVLDTARAQHPLCLSSVCTIGFSVLQSSSRLERVLDRVAAIVFYQSLNPDMQSAWYEYTTSGH